MVNNPNCVDCGVEIIEPIYNAMVSEKMGYEIGRICVECYYKERECDKKSQT